MRKSTRLSTFLVLSAILCAKMISAQGCQDTPLGYYSYSAIGTGIPGSLLTGTNTGNMSIPGSTTGTGAATGNSGSTMGTTSTSAAYTNTEIGQLLGGVSAQKPFASSGTVYFDGAGNIRAAATSQGGIIQGGLNQLVGTYVVNSDCTITVTLTDAFGNNPAATSLQGIIMSNASEIDLGVLQNVAIASASSSTGTSASGSSSTGTSASGSSSTGTSTTGSGATTPTAPAGLFASNTLIVLVRTESTFCSTGILIGPYALIATGTRVATVATNTSTGMGSTTGTGTSTGSATGPGTSSTSSTQTEAPFFLLARVQFDGNGKIVSPSSGGPSPLSSLQFTGSYTVNPDCTGMMTITNSPFMGTSSSGSTSTTTGTGSSTSTGTSTTSSNAGTSSNGSVITSSSTLNVNFVLTQPSVSFNAGGTPIANGAQAKPGLELSISNGTATLFGYGKAQ